MFQLPVLFMLISIFLYSLFPLVGVFGTGEISGFAFAGLSHMLSAAVSLLGALMLSGTSTEYGFRRLFHDLREDRSALRQAVLSGISNYLSHALLFVSFVYISKASATIVFDVWPILAIFFFVALARPLGDVALGTKPATIGKRVYFLSLVAFLGMVVIMLGDLNLYDLLNDVRGMSSLFDAKIGLVLAILSAVLMAYSVALGRNTRLFVQDKYGSCESHSAQLHLALLASAATKIFGALGFLLTIPFLPNFFPAVTSMSAIAWGWVVFNGAVIVTIGSLTYREALARTDRVELAVLWYTTPVFALFWLWISGVESLTVAVGLGALLIVSANALLHLRSDTTPAFVGVFLSLSITSVIVLMTPPVVLVQYMPNTSLVDLVALPIGLISILGGFLLERISSLHAEARLGVMHLTDYLEGRGEAVTSPAILGLVERRDLPENLQEQVRHLRLGQYPIIRPGELLVMWTLGLFSVICVTVFRVENVVGDALAVLTSSAICYIVLHLTFDARIRVDAVIRIVRRDDQSQLARSQRTLSLLIFCIMCAAVLVLSHIAHLGS